MRTIANTEQAIRLARNSNGFVTYKQAKDLLDEKHMFRAFGQMNELTAEWYRAAGDSDLFAHCHNGKGPGKGFYLWKARAAA